MCSFVRRRSAELVLLGCSDPAAVAELVDARRSGRRALLGVEVRVLSAALGSGCIRVGQ